MLAMVWRCGTDQLRPSSLVEHKLMGRAVTADDLLDDAELLVMPVPMAILERVAELVGQALRLVPGLLTKTLWV